MCHGLTWDGMGLGWRKYFSSLGWKVGVLGLELVNSRVLIWI